MPFNSAVFQRFAKQWNFNLTTSSPLHPKSNGLAERNVHTMKQMLRKITETNGDIYVGLLEWRNTPITGLTETPAQLLMGRRLRSVVPTVSHLLTPANVGNVQGQLKMLQEKQKHYYDRGSKALPELKPLDVVRIRTGTQWLPGFVESRHPSPRSFNVVRADGSHLRRNRSQLLSTKEAMPAINNDRDDDVPMSTIRQSNRSIRRPQRLIEQ